MRLKEILFSILFSVCLTIAFLSLPVAAQTTSLRGVLKDAQGGVLPGVTVTLTNSSTGATRDSTTDDLGLYQFLQVSPGTYTVKAELSGFKTAVREKVELLINTPGTLDLVLEVGELSETIEVQATTTLVNKSDATLGNAFTQLQVRQLPLEARNVVQLLSLQPGVVFIGDTGDHRNGAVNGGRSDQANITLDGVDVNDQVQGSAFTSVLRVTLDSVQEFRVTTAMPTADSGRSSGAQVALVTKSGSNEWHGSLYEYHRNTRTTANEYFLKRSQIQSGLPNEQPKLLRNVFGASAGGPILKDKLFFFANYEGRRDRSEASLVRLVPSENMRKGILSYQNAQGGVTTVSPEDLKKIDPLGLGANPRVLDVFNKFYPKPNDFGIGDGLNIAGFRFAAPVSVRQNTYITRLDYQLNANHSLFARGNLQNDGTAGTPQFPGQPPNNVFLNNSKGLAGGYTATFGPTLNSSLRYGYTRQGVEASGASVAPQVVTFRGLSDPVSMFNRSNGRIIPVHHLVEDISWVQGKHTFQFGGNVRWIQNQNFDFGNSFFSAVTNSSWLLGIGGDITPRDISSRFRTAWRDSAMATLGIVSQANARYLYDRNGNPLSVGSPKARNFAAEEYELYLQDSWRMTSNFTFTLGVRYSLFSPPYEQDGLQVAPEIPLGEWFDIRGSGMKQGIPSNKAPVIRIDLSGPKNNRSGYYEWDKNNFSPRVALAWSPSFQNSVLRTLFGATGQTSIRGGFSIAYDRVGSGLVSTFDRTGSFGLSTTLVNPSSSLNSRTAPRFTSLTEVPTAILTPAPKGGFPQTPPGAGQRGNFAIASSIDGTIKTPYSQMLSFSIQRELTKDLVFEVAYVGRLARKLLVQDDLAMPLNLFDPASGMDYFTAARKLHELIVKGAPVSQVGKIPYWENLFPGYAGDGLSATQAIYDIYQANSPDYTTALFLIDVGCRPCSKFGRYAFFNDQYSALAAWRSRAFSNYHGMEAILRKRFSSGFQFDLNYTFSKSIDIASNVERDGPYSGFTVNAWEPGLRKAVSNFDTTHNLNANYIIELPFGRDKWLGSDAHPAVNAFIGGWQLAGIVRITSGLPVAVGNGRFWPTNWNITGNATRLGSVPETETTKNAPAIIGPRAPNLFADPAVAIKSYANTAPGGVGERNDLRGDGYFSLDFGLSKSWDLPYGEGHRLQFRWEVFNATNSVRFDVFSLSLDLGNVGTFGKYNGTLTNPRVMQFGLRYEF